MFKNRYSFTSDTATSKITGNEGCVLVGWSLSLPEQAHQLILESTPDAIKEEKKFFLPYERHLPSDKLLADLRFSKSIGVIPVYCDLLPTSERVFLKTSVSFSIPTQIDNEYRNETRKIRQSILKLNSITSGQLQEQLSNIKYAFEDLLELCSNKESLNAKLVCFEFPSGISTDFHFALIIMNFNE